MQRTTVKLPDDLDARLRHEAERRGITVSQLTREAIETHLGAAGPRRRLLAAGAGASGREDISERIEELLRAESAPTVSRNSPTARRSARKATPPSH